MKNLKIIGLVLLAIAINTSCNSVASGPGKLKTANDSAAYMIGISIGHNMKQQELTELDPALVAKGIAEVLNNDSSLTPQDAQMYLNTYFAELQERMAREKIEEAADFFAENKTKEGVIELPSGLQYKVIEEGTGNSPSSVDSIKCHFLAKTLSGNTFQNTYERGMPAIFAISRNIQGLTQVIPLMKEGGKYELYIPSDLAYGPRGYGQQLGPNEMLIYEFELLEVIPHTYTQLEKTNLEKGKAFLAANKTKEGVIETASGLQYKVIEEGTGKSPVKTDNVRCHYRGTLISGDVFDSSYERGQPAEFPLNGVIRGWTEGLQYMKEGAKYEFYIPYDLGYGPAGSSPKIGPFEMLIFEVELIEVISN